MARSVKNWRGKTDDTPVPPRVKLRIVAAQGGECAGCTLPFGALRKPEFDHFIALVNGGENSEDNIIALCRACHGQKTKRDVAEKSTVARVRSKHLGIRRKSRPMPGSRASGIRKRMNGDVERWS